MAEKSDYLMMITAFSLLCQIGATTLLLLKHGEWGKALSSSIQLEIIAAITLLYLSVLYLILNLRSERGNVVSEAGKLIAYYFSMAIVYFRNQRVYDSQTLADLFGSPGDLLSGGWI